MTKSGGNLLSGTILALASLTPLIASAQTTGSAFLEINPDARSYALGRANAVAALGPQAMGANPANLGLMEERFGVFSSFAALVGGEQYGHIAFAFRPGSGLLDALGASITRTQVAGLAGADALGNQTGSNFGASDMAVSLGASGRVGSSLRVGLAVKALQSEIAGYKSNAGIAADLGATYILDLKQPVLLGASITNLGKGTRFISQTDPLPTTINVGASAPFGPLVAAAEMNENIPDRQTELGVGLEYEISVIAFRIGYAVEAGHSSNLALQDESVTARLLSGLSAGLGVTAGPVKFDYAVSEQAADYGPTQRASLSVRWGGKAAAPDRTEIRRLDRSDLMIRSLARY